MKRVKPIHPTGRQQRAVLIEPSGTLRTILELHLRLENYAVVTYSNDEEALTQLKQLQFVPDLIILDSLALMSLPAVLAGLQTWCGLSTQLIVLLPDESQQSILVEKIIRARATILFKPFRLYQLFAILNQAPSIHF